MEGRNRTWTGAALVAAVIVASGIAPVSALARHADPVPAHSASFQAAAPTDSIRLDADARFTGDRDVTVDIGPASGGRVIDAVRLRNVVDGVPDGWSDAATIDDIAWSLASGSDGPRIVDAQVHAAGGDWSDVMSDSITLDTTAPVASFEIINEFMASGDPWSAKAPYVVEPLLGVRVQDASFALGGDLTRIAIRVNDLPLRERDPDGSRTHNGDTITYTEIYDRLFDDYDYPRGTITIKARWRDEAGNWSDIATDSYELLQYVRVATLYADGSIVPQAEPDEPMPPPFAATNSATDMELRVRIDHLPVGPDGQTRKVDEIWVSAGSSGPWMRRSWGSGSERTLTWSVTDTRYGYTSGDGIKKVFVRLRPSVGRDRMLGVAVILDRVTPTSDEPVTAVAIGSVVGSGGDTAVAAGTSIKGSVAWDGADRTSKAKSGVGSFSLQRSVDHGSWKTQQLEKRTTRKTTSSLAASTDYRFRVRTTDRAGNRSSWKAGPELRPTVIPEDSPKIRYTGRWRVRAQDDALGGKLRATTTKGGSATLTFTGTGVAWVAPRSTDGDSVDVYIDGRKVKTAQLVASSCQPRRVVFSTAWTKRGRHTIRIVHRYAEHELPLDAFIVLR